jgi:hypothetical protein
MVYKVGVGVGPGSRCVFTTILPPPLIVVVGRGVSVARGVGNNGVVKAIAVGVAVVWVVQAVINPQPMLSKMIKKSLRVTSQNYS